MLLSRVQPDEDLLFKTVPIGSMIDPHQAAGILGHRPGAGGGVPSGGQGNDA
jgi:hypothetical protein